MSEPLKPQTSLLVKIGSMAVHADELLSDNGHAYDRVALQALLNDAEVKAWIEEMSAMALVPKKR